MSERNGVFVQSLYGVESVHGTQATLTNYFGTMKATMTPKVSTYEIDAGGIAPLAYAVGKSWTEVQLEGKPSYQEMAIVLSSILKVPSSTSYIPTQWVENAVYSYTFQTGDGVGAETTPGCYCTGMNFKVSEDDVSITTTWFGETTNTTTAFTTGATLAAGNIILPGQCTFSVDTTAQTRIINIEVDIQDRFKPLYCVDGNDTVAAMVEAKPNMTWKVEMEADAQGVAHFTRLKSTNATVLLNLSADTTGLALDFNSYAQIKDVDAFKISDTTYNVSYTFGVVYDVANTKSLWAVLDSTA